MIKVLPKYLPIRGYGVIKKDFDTGCMLMAIKPLHLVFRFLCWFEEKILRTLGFVFVHSGLVEVPEGERFIEYILQKDSWGRPWRFGSFHTFWWWTTEKSGRIRLIRCYQDRKLPLWLSGRLDWGTTK